MRSQILRFVLVAATSSLVACANDGRQQSCAFISVLVPSAFAVYPTKDASAVALLPHTIVYAAVSPGPISILVGRTEVVGVPVPVPSTLPVPHASSPPATTLFAVDVPPLVPGTQYAVLANGYETTGCGNVETSRTATRVPIATFTTIGN